MKLLVHMTLLLTLCIMIFPAKACRCAEEPTVDSAIESDAVISGLILKELRVSTSPSLFVRRFLVQVQKVYAVKCSAKPIYSRQQIIVTTPRNSCGVRLMPFGFYVFSGSLQPVKTTTTTTTHLLLPSNATSTSVTLSVSACTFTRSVASLTLAERKALKSLNAVC